VEIVIFQRQKTLYNRAIKIFIVEPVVRKRG
jgi:hypothetical protein